MLSLLCTFFFYLFSKVKIWFQNKRSKQKKIVKNVSRHSPLSSQLSNLNPSPLSHCRSTSEILNNKRNDSMFLVKQEREQEQEHEQEQHPPLTSSSTSSSTISNLIEPNLLNIDPVSSSTSSPYAHIEYTNNSSHFWPLPPYVTS